MLSSGRFIPACAGNSISTIRRCQSTAVHPRVCGEQFCIAVIAAGADGSSPRVRGTELHHLLQLGQRRFIPACAGNSLISQVATLISAVHPRVCGEQSITAAQVIQNIGSSPRVRGTASLVEV